MSRAAATASSTCSWRATPASSTNAAPSAYPSSTPRVSSSASLVFPAPPVPESVSSLVRASSERSSPSSRLRPTNELVSAGRPRGPGVEPSAASSRSRPSRSLGELFPPAGGEVVVAVLGQELAAVERERGAVARGFRGGPSRDGRLLEELDVHCRMKLEQPISCLDRLGPEGPSRRMHGLIQVVGAGRGAELRPERVDQLLAVQTLPRCEREQLHELPALPQPPGALRHRLGLDRGRKAAEEPDPDVRHAP